MTKNTEIRHSWHLLLFSYFVSLDNHISLIQKRMLKMQYPHLNTNGIIAEYITNLGKII